MLKLRHYIGIGFAFLFFAGSTFAYDLPPLHFGYVSFLNAVPLGPGYGWYFAQRYVSYDTQMFTNSHGGRLGGVSSPSYNPQLSITELTYLARNTSLLNAHLGITVFAPVLLAPNLQTPNKLGLRANQGGVCNPTISPFLFWGPLMLHGRPFWYNRVEFDNTIPIGKYSKNYQINPGVPFYNLASYWASTMLLTPKWELSSRFYYIWSAENPDTHIQAGQAVLENFATSYLIQPHLRLGIAGYYLKQLRNSKGNPAPNSKEQVLGIGPGVGVPLTPSNVLIFNYYTESHVENRTKGNRFVMSFVHSFG